MDAIEDFEDLLELLDKHQTRYLIIGGLAFIYHAKPRYTKDMDLWIGPEKSNVARANEALAEFGSPLLLDHERPGEIVQIGIAPNRIDLLLDVGPTDFDAAWDKRITATYGRSTAYWIDLDSLIEIKSNIDHPKHQEDARILRQVKALGLKSNR